MAHLRDWGRTGRVASLAIVAALVALGGWAQKSAEPSKVPGAKEALEPAAPVLPGEIIGALQEGRWEDAIQALKKHQGRDEATESEKAYDALLIGIAQRLDKKHDAARETVQAALKDFKDSPWVAKLRGELAVIELTSGHFEQAEAIARAEAEALLDHDRKDRLAEVYRQFAERLRKPDNPTASPDPEGAHALLEQARSVAKGEVLRASLLLAMAQTSQEAGNHPRAVAEFQQYLNETKNNDIPAEQRAQARFGLGESQLATGQPVQARMTWDDLARDLKGNGPADLRARALYQIARTYSRHYSTSPPDDTQLRLGVAALRRFLEAYPAHPLAVRAAFEIGVAYQSRGKSQEALEAFTAFLKGDDYQAETDEAKRDLAERTMTAQFQVGQILQGQGKFDEALAAYQGYLAKFPNGPQSADAQRAILDTKLLIAQDHLRHERFEAARDAWRQFVAENPLDGRVPQILFQIGSSFVQEKKYDEAIAAFENLASKFPNSEPAGHAQYMIAYLYETERHQPAEAIERYRKIAVEPWRSTALQRVAAMESKALTVVTPHAFRSGETPKLKISTRNIEKLTFSAYKLNPEAYFRKKLELDGVESLDIGLVAPDAEWTAPVPDYEKYVPFEQTYELKVDVPGVYVVKVTDETNLQATTLVLGSDLDAIVKSSREQMLVFVQDMKTGEGREKARVLVAQGGEVILDARTGEDGVLLHSWDKPRDPNAALSYLVLDGPHAAGSGLNLPGTIAQGLSPRAYLYTDRPAYRPGQEVALRGVVREVKDGQYAVTPGAEYKLEVTDSKGRPFLSRPVTLSKFGTFHEQVAIDSGAPVGTYRVRLYQPGKNEFSGQFEVQAYQLEKIDLSFDLPRTVYYRGETIEGDVIARYQYGTPLAGRPIVLSMPDGRTLSGQTDAQGKYHFKIETEGFGEQQALQFIAQLPQDNVAIDRHGHACRAGVHDRPAHHADRLSR